MMVRTLRGSRSKGNVHGCCSSTRTRTMTHISRKITSLVDADGECGPPARTAAGL